MRPLSPRSALSLAAVTLALAVPRAAGARLQGTGECPTPPPAPAPNTSYSCNFARMPLYDQGDPNLAFMSIPCSLYNNEASVASCSSSCVESGTEVCCNDGWQSCSTGTCSQPACGAQEASFPFAQSWLPWGPAGGDFACQNSGSFFSYTCSSISEAMVLNAALAYRSPNTAIVGEYCTSSSQCPVGYLCNGNTCTPAEASCSSTSFCPTGYNCESGVCVAAACSSTTPCPSGYTCGSTGVCAPTNGTAWTINRPTELPANPPGTYYTYSFAQGAHPNWTWNCTDYTTVGAALTALPPGFLGGCMGGAPNLLWPGSYLPGSVPTVAGLEQAANMSALTNMQPNVGYINPAGGYNWAYGQSFQPFAAELYNNASDSASCQTDANCVSGYCMASPGVFFVAGSGGHGTCASAAYQDFDSSSPQYGITTASLRAVIDRGGVGVLGQVPFTVQISGGQMTFTNAGSHYVALEGYTVSYDQYTNETLTFTINDSAWGIQQSSTLVDVANGGPITLDSGPDDRQEVNVVLPDNVTSAVLWPVGTMGTGTNQIQMPIHSAADLQDGETVSMCNTAFFLYVQ